MRQTQSLTVTLPKSGRHPLWAQGCEVLVWLSRSSDAEKHERVVREEIFYGVDGGFYQRAALSEYELAMHFLLTRVDDLVVIVNQAGADEKLHVLVARQVE